LPDRTVFGLGEVRIGRSSVARERFCQRP